jgi:hypothetical protein
VCDGGRPESSSPGAMPASRGALPQSRVLHVQSSTARPRSVAESSIDGTDCDTDALIDDRSNENKHHRT